MKILDRYIGKQLLVTSLFAIGVLSVVLVLGNIFKRMFDLLINHDVPLTYILTFVGYILPFSLTFTIPWGFLTAVLLVFGKLSAENELLALRTNGLSIPRISAALFVFAAICSALCFWINVQVAPRAQDKLKSATFNMLTHNPIMLFSSDQVIDEFPGNKIYVQRKEGNKLFGLLVYKIDGHGNVEQQIYAKEGSLIPDPKAKEVILQLGNARYEQHDSAMPNDLTKIRQGISMEKGSLSISLKELYKKNKKRRGLSEQTLSELVETNPKTLDKGEQSALKTEIQKRYSFSLACIAFALVGLPLAITTQRKETSIGFVLSLIIAFVYFFFIILANLARNHPAMHPALLIWMPNLIFIPLGAFLFIRLCRR